VLRNKNLSSTEIWIYDTKSRETRLVDTIDLILFSVKWGRDQRSIVYQNQFNQIVSLDINKNVKTVLFESEIPFDTPVPFDSGMAFRTGATKNRDLEKINLVEGTRELYESSSYRDTLPAISPQGNKVAWVSNRSGLYQVWYKEEDGIPHQITHIKNQIQFEGLTFNIDGTKLGGTASGRWFVIDLKDFSITWSSSNSYFTNFSWTRESGVAYVLMKDVERSELLRLNTQTLEMLPSELPKDAFIAMDDYNSEVTFYATLSKKGFWRITKSGNQKVSHYFNIPVVVNHTLMWSSTIKGLYYSWEGQLYFLDHSSETIEMVDSINDITYFSMPINAYWLLNIKVTQSDTDIKFIE
jgi:hypothetical protein